MPSSKIKREAEKEMKEEETDPMRERIRVIKNNALSLGLRDDEVRALFNLKSSQNNRNFIRILKTKLLFRKIVVGSDSMKPVFTRTRLFAIFVAAFAFLLFPPSEWDWYDIRKEIQRTRCIIPIPGYLSEVFRPRVPCGICKDLYSVPVVYNITKETFFKKYAYTGVPVLIKGAIDNWGALDVFSYSYFKELYTTTNGSLDHVHENCQYFQYQTEFRTLDAVFNMSDDRAALKTGTRPWYVGWSNCGSNGNDAGRELRKQYNRPYFLPDFASTLDTDWMFMGGPGYGAAMHIDNVGRPSWQAQVSGSKTWILDPTPECWKSCKRLEVDVEKGDIIVVDTNIWYHSTRVNPGNISITIGAEYD